MYCMVLYCRWYDSEVKKSVESGDIWKKIPKNFSTVILKDRFLEGWCGKLHQNTLVSIYVRNFSTNPTVEEPIQIFLNWKVYGGVPFDDTGKLQFHKIENREPLMRSIILRL